jgi:AraC-like DNA-binding protein
MQTEYATTYCAATLRLFSRIDVDAIDGQTVEDARVLQPAISEYIRGACNRPVWSYKRNILETLYIFEMRDQQALLKILADTAAWLRNSYHVDARWGVGTPTDDLMHFWKSYEEAAAALSNSTSESAVCLYTCDLAADDLYYFPYAAEEHLVEGLRAGDTDAVEAVLGLLQQENFVRRSLSRSQFHKLNRRLMDILSPKVGTAIENSPALMHLNELVFDYSGNCETYFEELNALCQQLCEETAQQKSSRRLESVRLIEKYLRTNYKDQSLCLAKASADFDLSEGYLSSIFKKETGTNFAEYLENVRVHAACTLLREGTRVTDIAEDVGYNSIQTFRRAFKRVMGVSPSEYRG